MPLTTKPAAYNYVINNNLRDAIEDKGYGIVNTLNAEELAQLQVLYKEKHELTATGMFYSLYSKDLEYRKEIYDRINNILEGFFKTHFSGFKSLYNIFILKAPGRESELFIHQEPSMMDESKFSPLHVWIPLEDIDENNGAVCLVEKSNRIFSPLRGSSFPLVFENILPTVKKYMTPFYLKAGQALVFDPRLIHFSLSNFSDHTRAAVVCGLAPVEADIIIAHKEHDPEDKIELIKQQPDFFLTYEDFYLTCKCRPEPGEFIGYSNYKPYSLTAEGFEEFCKGQGIGVKNVIEATEQTECIMYGEPKQEMNLHNSKTFNYNE